jgi:hypothetical protein
MIFLVSLYLRLFGRAVRQERVLLGDLGEGVERDLAGEDGALGRGGLHLHRVDLVLELLEREAAGAADGLVGRDDDALDLRRVVDRLERHDHLDRGAVGVRDDALVLPDVARVDLRDDERRAGVHAPGAGVVHDHGALLGEERRVLLGDRRPGAEEREVELLDPLGRQAHDAARLAVDVEDLALRLGRGVEDDFRAGELPLLDALDELEADRARGADDGDAIGFAHGTHPSRFRG